MLVLPAEIHHTSAKACERMLLQAVAEQAGDVVVDASALQRFDSSALAVLLECRREAQIKGRSFSVRHLPERLSRLAGLYGLTELLPMAA